MSADDAVIIALVTNSVISVASMLTDGLEAVDILSGPIVDKSASSIEAVVLPRIVSTVVYIKDSAVDFSSKSCWVVVSSSPVVISVNSVSSPVVESSPEDVKTISVPAELVSSLSRSVVVSAPVGLGIPVL